MAPSLEIAPQAQNDIEDALSWLRALAPDAPGRFTDALTDAFAFLAVRLQEQIDGKAPLHPDEGASLALARPVFQHRFATGRTRRRSGSGVWRIFFDLNDRNGDGTPDTLRVLAVRHAAAAPLWNPETAP